MIHLKIRITNSILGTWACEELKEEHDMNDPLAINKSIPEAIEDFLYAYKVFNGFTPNYKWS